MPITLIETIISLLPSITTGFGHLLDFINANRIVARQTGEWTQDMQAAFEKALDDRARLNAYKTDVELMRQPLPAVKAAADSVKP